MHCFVVGENSIYPNSSRFVVGEKKWSILKVGGSVQFYNLELKNCAVLLLQTSDTVKTSFLPPRLRPTVFKIEDI